MLNCRGPTSVKILFNVWILIFTGALNTFVFKLSPCIGQGEL